MDDDLFHDINIMILSTCCMCMCIFLFCAILLVVACTTGRVIWSRISLGFLRLGCAGLCGRGRSLLSRVVCRYRFSLIFWSLLSFVCLLMVESSIWMLASLDYLGYLMITLNALKMFHSILENFGIYDIFHSTIDQVIAKFEH